MLGSVFMYSDKFTQINTLLNSTNEWEGQITGYQFNADTLTSIYFVSDYDWIKKDLSHG